MSTRQVLLDLADRCEREEPSRELSDAVMFACGWRTNFSAAEIEEVRNGGRLLQDDAGDDYLQPYDEFMDYACWYAPGSKPFRDKWIHGHYRPHPTASLDAAVTLVPKKFGVVFVWSDENAMVSLCSMPLGTVEGQRWFPQCKARTPALALCAASLRARAEAL